MATITIPDYLAERLEEMAREQGLSVVQLLKELAGQRSLPADPTPEQRRARLKAESTGDDE